MASVYGRHWLKLKQSILKVVSTFTVLCFTASSVFAEASSSFSSVTLKSKAFEEVIPASLVHLEASNLPQSEPQNTVYYIQDAHSSSEAQQKIYQILTTLKNQKRLRAVLLEGAAGKLNKKNSLFHELQLSPKVLPQLAGKNLISGAERFVLENPEIPAWGIEDVQSYRHNLDQYREVLIQSKISKSYLQDLKTKFYRILRRHLSKKAFGFTQHWVSVQEQADYLSPYLEFLLLSSTQYLEMNWEDPQLQFAWPNFIRFYRLSHLNQALLLKKAQEEWEELKIQGPLRELLELSTDPSYQASLPPSQIRKMIESSISQIQEAGLKIEAYEALSNYFQFLILKHEIKTAGLFQEVTQLENLIFEKLIPSKSVRRIFPALRDFFILNRAFQLELTRQEAADFRARLNEFYPDRFKKLLGNRETLKHETEIAALLIQIKRFYDGAEDREEAFHSTLKRIFSKVSSEDPAHFAFIAGGYHTEGIQRKMIEGKIPYFIFSPLFQLSPSDTFYKKNLLGDYSSTLASVPGLLLDSAANRLMMGNSYFDQYLKKIRSETRDSFQPAKKKTTTLGRWLSILLVAFGLLEGTPSISAPLPLPSLNRVEPFYQLSASYQTVPGGEFESHGEHGEGLIYAPVPGEVRWSDSIKDGKVEKGEEIVYIRNSKLQQQMDKLVNEIKLVENELNKNETLVNPLKVWSLKQEKGSLLRRLEEEQRNDLLNHILAPEPLTEIQTLVKNGSFLDENQYQDQLLLHHTSVNRKWIQIHFGKDSQLPPYALLGEIRILNAPGAEIKEKRIKLDSNRNSILYLRLALSRPLPAEELKLEIQTLPHSPAPAINPKDVLWTTHGLAGFRPPPFKIQGTSQPGPTVLQTPENKQVVEGEMIGYVEGFNHYQILLKQQLKRVEDAQARLTSIDQTQYRSDYDLVENVLRREKDELASLQEKTRPENWQITAGAQGLLSETYRSHLLTSTPQPAVIVKPQIWMGDPKASQQSWVLIPNEFADQVEKAAVLVQPLGTGILLPAKVEQLAAAKTSANALLEDYRIVKILVEDHFWLAPGMPAKVIFLKPDAQKTPSPAANPAVIPFSIELNAEEPVLAQAAAWLSGKNEEQFRLHLIRLIANDDAGLNRIKALGEYQKQFTTDELASLVFNSPPESAQAILQSLDIVKLSQILEQAVVQQKASLIAWTRFQLIQRLEANPERLSLLLNDLKQRSFVEELLENLLIAEGPNSPVGNIILRNKNEWTNAALVARYKKLASIKEKSILAQWIREELLRRIALSKNEGQHRAHGAEYLDGLPGYFGLTDLTQGDRLYAVTSNQSSATRYLDLSFQYGFGNTALDPMDPIIADAAIRELNELLGPEPETSQAEDETPEFFPEWNLQDSQFDLLTEKERIDYVQKVIDRQDYRYLRGMLQSPHFKAVHSQLVIEWLKIPNAHARLHLAEVYADPHSDEETRLLLEKNDYLTTLFQDAEQTLHQLNAQQRLAILQASTISVFKKALAVAAQRFPDSVIEKQSLILASAYIEEFGLRYYLAESDEELPSDAAVSAATLAPIIQLQLEIHALAYAYAREKEKRSADSEVIVQEGPEGTFLDGLLQEFSISNLKNLALEDHPGPLAKLRTYQQENPNPVIAGTIRLMEERIQDLLQNRYENVRFEKPWRNSLVSFFIFLSGTALLGFSALGGRMLFGNRKNAEEFNEKDYLLDGFQAVEREIQELSQSAARSESRTFSDVVGDMEEWKTLLKKKGVFETRLKTISESDAEEMMKLVRRIVRHQSMLFTPGMVRSREAVIRLRPFQHTLSHLASLTAKRFREEKFTKSDLRGKAPYYEAYFLDVADYAMYFRGPVLKEALPVFQLFSRQYQWHWVDYFPGQFNLINIFIFFWNWTGRIMVGVMRGTHFMAPATYFGKSRSLQNLEELFVLGNRIERDLYPEELPLAVEAAMNEKDSVRMEDRASIEVGWNWREVLRIAPLVVFALAWITFWLLSGDYRLNLPSIMETTAKAMAISMGTHFAIIVHGFFDFKSRAELKSIRKLKKQLVSDESPIDALRATYQREIDDALTREPHKAMPSVDLITIILSKEDEALKEQFIQRVKQFAHQRTLVDVRAVSDIAGSEGAEGKAILHYINKGEYAEKRRSGHLYLPEKFEETRALYLPAGGSDLDKIHILNGTATDTGTPLGLKGKAGEDTFLSNLGLGLRLADQNLRKKGMVGAIVMSPDKVTLIPGKIKGRTEGLHLIETLKSVNQGENEGSIFHLGDDLLVKMNQADLKLYAEEHPHIQGRFIPDNRDVDQADVLAEIALIRYETPAAYRTYLQNFTAFHEFIGEKVNQASAGSGLDPSYFSIGHRHSWVAYYKAKMKGQQAVDSYFDYLRNKFYPKAKDPRRRFYRQIADYIVEMVQEGKIPDIHLISYPSGTSLDLRHAISLRNYLGNPGRYVPLSRLDPEKRKASAWLFSPHVSVQDGIELPSGAVFWPGTMGEVNASLPEGIEVFQPTVTMKDGSKYVVTVFMKVSDDPFNKNERVGNRLLGITGKEAGKLLYDVNNQPIADSDDIRNVPLFPLSFAGEPTDFSILLWTNYFASKRKVRFDVTKEEFANTHVSFNQLKNELLPRLDYEAVAQRRQGVAAKQMARAEFRSETVYEEDHDSVVTLGGLMKGIIDVENRQIGFLPEIEDKMKVWAYQKWVSAHQIPQHLNLSTKNILEAAEQGALKLPETAQGKELILDAHLFANQEWKKILSHLPASRIVFTVDRRQDYETLSHEVSAQARERGIHLDLAPDGLEKYLRNLALKSKNDAENRSILLVSEQAKTQKTNLQNLSRIFYFENFAGEIPSLKAATLLSVLHSPLLFQSEKRRHAPQPIEPFLTRLLQNVEIKAGLNPRIQLQRPYFQARGIHLDNQALMRSESRSLLEQPEKFQEFNVEIDAEVAHEFERRTGMQLMVGTTFRFKVHAPAEDSDVDPHLIGVAMLYREKLQMIESLLEAGFSPSENQITVYARWEESPRWEINAAGQGEQHYKRHYELIVPTKIGQRNFILDVSHEKENGTQFYEPSVYLEDQQRLRVGVNEAFDGNENHVPIAEILSAHGNSDASKDILRQNPLHPMTAFRIFGIFPGSWAYDVFLKGDKNPVARLLLLRREHWKNFVEFSKLYKYPIPQRRIYQFSFFKKKFLLLVYRKGELLTIAERRNESVLHELQKTKKRELETEITIRASDPTSISEVNRIAQDLKGTDSDIFRSVKDSILSASSPEEAKRTLRKAFNENHAFKKLAREDNERLAWLHRLAEKVPHRAESRAQRNSHLRIHDPHTPPSEFDALLQKGMESLETKEQISRQSEIDQVLGIEENQSVEPASTPAPAKAKKKKKRNLPVDADAIVNELLHRQREMEKMQWTKYSQTASRVGVAVGAILLGILISYYAFAPSKSSVMPATKAKIIKNENFKSKSKRGPPAAKAIVSATPVVTLPQMQEDPTVLMPPVANRTVLTPSPIDSDTASVPLPIVAQPSMLVSTDAFEALSQARQFVPSLDSFDEVTIARFDWTEPELRMIDQILEILKIHPTEKGQNPNASLLTFDYWQNVYFPRRISSAIRYQPAKRMERLMKLKEGVLYVLENFSGANPKLLPLDIPRAGNREFGEFELGILQSQSVRGISPVTVLQLADAAQAIQYVNQMHAELSRLRLKKLDEVLKTPLQGTTSPVPKGLALMANLWKANEIAKFLKQWNALPLEQRTGVLGRNRIKIFQVNVLEHIDSNFATAAVGFSPTFDAMHLQKFNHLAAQSGYGNWNQFIAWLNIQMNRFYFKGFAAETNFLGNALDSNNYIAQWDFLEVLRQNNPADNSFVRAADFSWYVMNDSGNPVYLTATANAQANDLITELSSLTSQLVNRFQTTATDPNNIMNEMAADGQRMQGKAGQPIGETLPVMIAQWLQDSVSGNVTELFNQDRFQEARDYLDDQLKEMREFSPRRTRQLAIDEFQEYIVTTSPEYLDDRRLLELFFGKFRSFVSSGGSDAVREFLSEELRGQDVKGNASEDSLIWPGDYGRDWYKDLSEARDKQSGWTPQVKARFREVLKENRINLNRINFQGGSNIQIILRMLDRLDQGDEDREQLVNDFRVLLTQISDDVKRAMQARNPARLQLFLKNATARSTSALELSQFREELEGLLREVTLPVLMDFVMQETFTQIQSAEEEGRGLIERGYTQGQLSQIEKIESQIILREAMKKLLGRFHVSQDADRRILNNTVAALEKRNISALHWKEVLEKASSEKITLTDGSELKFRREAWELFQLYQRTSRPYIPNWKPKTNQDHKTYWAFLEFLIREVQYYVLKPNYAEERQQLVDYLTRENGYTEEDRSMTKALQMAHELANLRADLFGTPTSESVPRDFSQATAFERSFSEMLIRRAAESQNLNSDLEKFKRVVDWAAPLENRPLLARAVEQTLPFWQAVLGPKADLPQRINGADMAQDESFILYLRYLMFALNNRSDLKKWIEEDSPLLTDFFTHHPTERLALFREAFEKWTEFKGPLLQSHFEASTILEKISGNETGGAYSNPSDQERFEKFLAQTDSSALSFYIDETLEPFAYDWIELQDSLVPTQSDDLSPFWSVWDWQHYGLNPSPIDRRAVQSLLERRNDLHVPVPASAPPIERSQSDAVIKPMAQNDRESLIVPMPGTTQLESFYWSYRSQEVLQVKGDDASLLFPNGMKIYLASQGQHYEPMRISSQAPPRVIAAQDGSSILYLSFVLQGKTHHGLVHVQATRKRSGDIQLMIASDFKPQRPIGLQKQWTIQEGSGVTLDITLDPSKQTSLEWHHPDGTNSEIDLQEWSEKRVAQDFGGRPNEIHAISVPGAFSVQLDPVWNQHYVTSLNASPTAGPEGIQQDYRLRIGDTRMGQEIIQSHLQINISSMPTIHKPSPEWPAAPRKAVVPRSEARDAEENIVVETKQYLEQHLNPKENLSVRLDEIPHSIKAPYSVGRRILMNTVQRLDAARESELFHFYDNFDDAIRVSFLEPMKMVFDGMEDEERSLLAEAMLEHQIPALEEIKENLESRVRTEMRASQKLLKAATGLNGEFTQQFQLAHEMDRKIRAFFKKNQGGFVLIDGISELERQPLLKILESLGYDAQISIDSQEGTTPSAFSPEFWFYKIDEVKGLLKNIAAFLTTSGLPYEERQISKLHLQRRSRVIVHGRYPWMATNELEIPIISFRVLSDPERVEGQFGESFSEKTRAELISYYTGLLFKRWEHYDRATRQQVHFTIDLRKKESYASLQRLESSRRTESRALVIPSPSSSLKAQDLLNLVDPTLQKIFEVKLNQGIPMRHFSLPKDRGAIPDTEELVMLTIERNVPLSHTEYRLIIAPAKQIRKEMPLLWNGPIMPGEHYERYPFIFDFLVNHELKTIHLANMAVSPRLQGQGIGKRTFENWVQLLKKSFPMEFRVSSVTLEKSIPGWMKRFFNAANPSAADDENYKIMEKLEVGEYRTPQLSQVWVGTIGGAPRSEFRSNDFGISIVSAKSFKKADLEWTGKLLEQYPYKMQIVMVEGLQPQEAQELNLQAKTKLNGRLILAPVKGSYEKTVEAIFNGDRRLFPYLKEMMPTVNGLIQKAGLGTRISLAELLMKYTVVVSVQDAENKDGLLSQAQTQLWESKAESNPVPRFLLSLAAAGVRLKEMDRQLLENFDRISSDPSGQRDTAVIAPTHSLIDLATTLMQNAFQRSA